MPLVARTLGQDVTSCLHRDPGPTHHHPSTAGSQQTHPGEQSPQCPTAGRRGLVTPGPSLGTDTASPHTCLFQCSEREPPTYPPTRRQVGSSHCKEVPQTGGFNSRHLLPHSPGGWESKIEALVGVVSPEAPLLRL